MVTAQTTTAPQITASAEISAAAIIAQANKSHVINAQKLRAIKAKIEVLESQKKELEKDLKAAFQVDEYTLADELRTASGQLLATWKEVISFPLNTKKLEKAHPEIIQEFKEMRITRRFVLK